MTPLTTISSCPDISAAYQEGYQAGRASVLKPLDVKSVHINHEMMLENPEERSALARYADYVGYIPGIGSAIGVTRVVCGIAMRVFKAIDLLLCKAMQKLSRAGSLAERSWSQLADTCSFPMRRAVDEMKRGLLEIIPGVSLVYHWKQSKDESKGKIMSGTACGHYIYKASDAQNNHYLCYSQRRHDGQASWKVIIDEEGDWLEVTFKV